ncbi:Trp family transcriptional regulator [Psychrobacter sp. FDAARGOS_221]|uniref:Trp family transcriptional regulator n=1 Tax=Psychrobacter sp. FDAARGOS_221 TaxID=1975705 RepID=UPI000BB54A10|nr:Trp family transcriptional regulator [Psychrobacter sp. FDAARGOS_221]PNK59608.1 transcriptional regulator [Psychrobacter sp. FDAARGOS_221]
MNHTDQTYYNLMTHLAQLSDPKQIDAVLGALLTDKERQDIANRIRIFDLLDQGTTQRAISQELGVGIATVSRGAKAMQQQQNITAISALLTTQRES